jgi:hypothetical protein
VTLARTRRAAFGGFGAALHQLIGERPHPCGVGAEFL